MHGQFKDVQMTQALTLHSDCLPVASPSVAEVTDATE